MKKTFRCPICNEKCNDICAKKECFMSHTEQEHMRWTAKELHRITSECYNVFGLVDGIIAKYELDEDVEETPPKLSRKDN